jgi:predicted glycosyltransferase
MVQFLWNFNSQPWVLIIVSVGGGGSGAIAINQFLDAK